MTMLSEPVSIEQVYTYRTDFVVDDVRRSGVRHRVTRVTVVVTNSFDNGIDVRARLFGHRITKTGERSKTGERGQVFPSDVGLEQEIVEEWKASHPISKLWG